MIATELERITHVHPRIEVLGLPSWWRAQLQFEEEEKEEQEEEEEEEEKRQKDL